MGCPSEPLPALSVAPVPVESGPEVADPAAGVPEWIVDTSAIEHASDPLPVVGGIVADEDRPPAAQMILEPGRESLSDFGVGREPSADDWYRRVGGVRGRVEQASMKRVTAVVVNGPELGQHAVYRAGAACLTVDEYGGRTVHVVWAALAVIVVLGVAVPLAAWLASRRLVPRHLPS